MDAPLLPLLILLATSVIALVLCRITAIPPTLGYLATGALLGPVTLGGLAESAAAHALAEFGVVFLMFSIGLEFSLPKLALMRRAVFGLGLAQVAATLAIALPVSLAAGVGWKTGLVVGGALAMSSTAIVLKLLAERLELDSPHGRAITGVLLFQDLAVVPLLIVIPALGGGEDLAGSLAVAFSKAAVVLGLMLIGGARLMRLWLGIVARRRSTELFVLNVLLITLGLSWLGSIAGLPLAIGAFVAGILISETEYRFQVEEDIRPFRDVLLGLFFVTVGARLDYAAIIAAPALVLLFLLVLVAGKAALAAGLARLFGESPGSALRTGLALAQAGEFGLVLLGVASHDALLPVETAQPLLAAMLLSMFLSPLVIGASNRIVLRLARSEWMTRSLELHRIAVQSVDQERHVVILGYGRNGQHLARLLEAENIRYLAFDLDPERVREATLAGERVVFADCSRRESLVAAGLARASAVVVTFSDVAAACKVLAAVHALAPGVPVIARAHAESDAARLTAAGASEVVPEALESGLMLAVHALVWTGVPLARAIRRMRQVRDDHYGLLRGFFHGTSDALDLAGEESRLHAVTLLPQAWAIGRSVADCGLDVLGAEVRAVRRPNVDRKLGAQDAGPLQERDVLVLVGTANAINAAETRLLRG